MTTEEILAENGLRAFIRRDGCLAVESFDGMDCWYSSRQFVPVAFPGLKTPVYARLLFMGRGEIKIGDKIMTIYGEKERLEIA